MKNKKQFTLIELIIVIVVIGILAAMALPKFNGVVRNAKLANMINDKEVLEKTLVLYYQKHDELPLLNEDQELVVQNENIGLTKIVLAEEATNGDMDTIYKSLKETLTYYNDNEETLYRIDLPKIKGNLSKDIKYGHKKHDKDFYVYSVKTGNVYYYDFLVNGNGTFQHTEYDTLLKDNELITKNSSPSLNDEKDSYIENNTFSLGNSHSAKIGKDGNLYTWGVNVNGELGIGDTIYRKTPQLVTLSNGEKFTCISLGTNVTMAITDRGNLYSWGENRNGQLGIGNLIDQTNPQLVTIPNGEKPISIALGQQHSMVVTDKGNLYSWGYNNLGQLGLGNTIDQLTYDYYK